MPHYYSTFIFQPWLHPLTLPAGSDGELYINLRRVDRPVVRHQIGVIGHAVHIQRHHGKLDINDIVMPLLITDLTERKWILYYSLERCYTLFIININNIKRLLFYKWINWTVLFGHQKQQKDSKILRFPAEIKLLWDSRFWDLYKTR